jgi:ribosomal protein S18 acetylase RimI-like enzyme
MSETEPHAARIHPISSEEAAAHVDELYRLVSLIPEVPYDPQDLLATSKPDGRVMHAKWQHTYGVFSQGALVGFVMGYEREAEANSNYPVNSLYISELAIDPAYRGLGYARRLLRRQFQDVLSDGFHVLEGPVVFSLQTNSAEWNESVRQLYHSFGFQDVGEKQYPNRRDVVMRASADEVEQALYEGEPADS